VFPALLQLLIHFDSVHELHQRPLPLRQQLLLELSQRHVGLVSVGLFTLQPAVLLVRVVCVHLHRLRLIAAPPLRIDVFLDLPRGYLCDQPVHVCHLLNKLHDLLGIGDALHRLPHRPTDLRRHLLLDVPQRIVPRIRDGLLDLRDPLRQLQRNGVILHLVRLWPAPFWLHLLFSVPQWHFPVVAHSMQSLLIALRELRWIVHQLHELRRQPTAAVQLDLFRSLPIGYLPDPDDLHGLQPLLCRVCWIAIDLHQLPVRPAPLQQWLRVIVPLGHVFHWLCLLVVLVALRNLLWISDELHELLLWLLAQRVNLLTFNRLPCHVRHLHQWHLLGLRQRLLPVQWPVLQPLPCWILPVQLLGLCLLLSQLLDLCWPGHDLHRLPRQQCPVQQRLPVVLPDRHVPERLILSRLLLVVRHLHRIGLDLHQLCRRQFPVQHDLPVLVPRWHLCLEPVGLFLVLLDVRDLCWLVLGVHRLPSQPGPLRWLVLLVLSQQHVCFQPDCVLGLQRALHRVCRLSINMHGLPHWQLRLQRRLLLDLPQWNLCERFDMLTLRLALRNLFLNRIDVPQLRCWLLPLWF